MTKLGRCAGAEMHLSATVCYKECDMWVELGTDDCPHATSLHALQESGKLFSRPAEPNDTGASSAKQEQGAIDNRACLDPAPPVTTRTIAGTTATTPQGPHYGAAAPSVERGLSEEQVTEAEVRYHLSHINCETCERIVRAAARLNALAAQPEAKRKELEDDKSNNS